MKEIKTNFAQLFNGRSREDSLNKFRIGAAIGVAITIVSAMLGNIEGVIVGLGLEAEELTRHNMVAENRFQREHLKQKLVASES